MEGVKTNSELGRLLQTHDRVGIKAWAKREANAFGSLQVLLFESEELLRWRAIEALGLAAAVKAETDREPVRNLLRRLFFSLNEDSGMVGWHSPEAMGEVLAQVPALIGDYAANLGSVLLRPPFERGAHWAVARMAAVQPEAASQCAGELLLSLGASDPYLRGYAVMALAAMHWTAARAGLEALQDDPGRLTRYDFDAGELKEIAVGPLARAALLTLNGA